MEEGLEVVLECWTGKSKSIELTKKLSAPSKRSPLEAFVDFFKSQVVTCRFRSWYHEYIQPSSFFRRNSAISVDRRDGEAFLLFLAFECGCSSNQVA